LEKGELRGLQGGKGRGFFAFLGPPNMRVNVARKREKNRREDTRAKTFNKTGKERLN